MRAIRIHEFGAPEGMRLEEVADLRPGAEEVLVRIEAAGVNPHDTYVRAGLVPGCALPLTPGQDGAGVVEAVGSAVTSCAAGERVYVGGSLSGTYATHALCHAKQVHELPERLSCAEAAAIHVPYATAHRALFGRAAARAGETVLVHGASGSVGLAAVQLARAAGLRVLGTGGSERGRALVTGKARTRCSIITRPTWRSGYGRRPAGAGRRSFSRCWRAPISSVISHCWRRTGEWW